MLRIFSIFAFIITIQGFLFGQKDTTFFDSENKVCKRSKADYYFVFIKKKDKGYLQKQMDMRNRPQMIAECSSINPVFYDGTCTYYYDYSNSTNSCTIETGRRYGEWAQCGIWKKIKNNGKDTTYDDRGYHDVIGISIDSIYHYRLYIGIDNPITITAPDILDIDSMEVRITNGTIRGKNGKYIVNVEKEGKAIFQILYKNKSFGFWESDIAKIPEPEAYIGKARGECRPSRDEIAKAGCITVQTPRYDVPSKYKVVSFSMSFVMNGLFIDINSKSACLTDKMKEVILDRNNKGVVLIEEVWAIGPDSIKKKLPGLVMKFDLDDTKAELTTEQMKSKVQQMENERINQEKMMLAQTNKLNEAELTKEKALASAKENELSMVHQQQKMKAMEDEQKETAHKAELKQRSIILNSVLAGLLIVLVFSGFVVRSLRVRNKQNKIIVEQKTIVEEKQREILDSIEYALRIQTAILPPQRIVKQYLENSFILYKPKDIVAGDFYWMEAIQLDNVPISQFGNEINEKDENNLHQQIGTLSNCQIVLFAACDCTGHGVPGAMVSVVCHNALNRAVREFGLTQPAAILDKTAEIVIENFSKSEENIKDGMDISLASITYDSQSKKIELQWAGANNPLWIVRGKGNSNDASSDVLIETKADKQPIGMNEDKKPFTNHSFALQSGDSIYLFTDGFADQFGGDTGEKKLTRKRFKEVLLSIQHLSMNQQGIELDKFITEYRKEVEQIDDILVMGVRV